MKYSGIALLLDDPNYIEKQENINIWEGISWGYDEEQWEVLESILHLIPSKEKNVLWMAFRLGRTQQEIAEHLNCSQPNVHYMIKRAIRRLKFIINRKDLDENDIMEHLNSREYLSDREAKILFLYWKTTSQTEVANLINKSQTLVYNELMSGIDKLKKENSKYYKTIKKCYDNSGILGKHGKS